MLVCPGHGEPSTLRACLKIHRDRIILVVILILKKTSKTDEEDEHEDEEEKSSDFSNTS
jgi:hypothetical protein